MDIVKTDWFPASEPPVNPGEYDVIVPASVVFEVEMRAVWQHRCGQWGFWKVDNWVDRTKLQLLTVLRWRGRILPRRVQLLVEQPVVRKRHQLIEDDA